MELRETNVFLSETVEDLIEAKVDKNVLMKIKKQTAINNHIGARMIGAKAMGHKRLYQKFELVDKLQALEGELPNGLYEYSGSLLKELLAYAKKKLSMEDFKSFRAAF